MDWLEHVSKIKAESQSCVLVSIVAVRGHAPREAGAKMVVTSSALSGSVGGGNLEQRCVVRARQMLEEGKPKTDLLTVPLTLKNSGQYGVQCCGGEVTLTLEHLNFSWPQVALFGAGHVGLALTRVLSTLPIEILLVDSRADVFPPPLARPPSPHLSSDPNPKATLTLIQKPFPQYPEQVVSDLKPGSSAVILTHDHAEDLAILEQCLRRPDLNYIGLIGSSVKWIHFREQLKAAGFSDADLERVTTPIGIPGVRGKTPEVIAIAVAAQLLEHLDLRE